MQNADPREIRRKKITALVISITVVVLLTVFVLIPALVRSNQAKTSYNRAMELFSSGQYLAAAEQFEACGEYSNATEMARQSYYAQADIHFDNQDYEHAADYYLKAEPYSNAVEQYNESMYQVGLIFLERRDYNGAAQAFMQAGLRHRDTMRYICNNAALSQAIPFPDYPLADRVADSLYYDYGEKVIDSISGDGSISGELYGNYSAEGEKLSVILAGEKDKIIDAFVIFLRHNYGVDSSEVESNVRSAVQSARAYESEQAFYLSQGSELMASIWVESGYYMMNVETVTRQATQQKASLEGKAQALVDTINQTAGKSIASLGFVNNDDEATIEIKLLFSDEGSCYITGSYDANSCVFSISTLSIGFDVGPKQEESAYIAKFAKAASVVYGIIEETFGLTIASLERGGLESALETVARVWYSLVVEDGGDMWMEETGEYSVNLAGMSFDFQVVGNWFGGTIECSGVSF